MVNGFNINKTYNRIQLTINKIYGKVILHK